MLALGGLVVAALFAALLVPFFVDWSSFRVAFEDQASRLLGKKVAVHGSVDARILPFPSVTLHDVRVGQDVDGQPLVQVAQFSMDMELAPFLSGEARIFDMRIDKPKVRFRILKDGTFEWLRGSRPTIAARSVILEDVHIMGGEIEIIDDRNGQVRHMTGLSTDLSAGTLAGPWRGEGNAVLDGQEARFSLTSGEAAAEGRQIPLRLRVWPDAHPVVVDFDGELAAVDNKPSYNGKFNLAFLQEEDESEPVKAPPPGPRVSGDFELTGERARIPQYRVEVGPKENPYIVTGEATLDTGPKPEFLLTADGQQIDVNRLSDGPQAKTGRNPAASAQRRLNAFVQMVASIPIPQVPGRVNLKLPAIVFNDTTIRDIHLDVRPAGRGWAVDNVTATLPGRTQLEAKGNLNLANRTAFVGDMLVASTQPSGLADWLSGSVDPAIRQLKNAGFSAKVNLTPELQRFEALELGIGPATLKGRLERQSPNGQAPSLSMALAGNEIDIDAMRALASLVTGDDAGQDVLDHRVAASLKADRLTALGVVATKVDTAFSVAEGVLSLERLTVGDIEGATLSAKGRVEGSLVSYGGTGSVSFRSPDPTSFITMLRDRLPHHPLLDRLARNGSWYAGSDLIADISLGGSGLGGANIKLRGKANGSTVDADLKLPGIFDLTAGNAMTLSASLANPMATVLLGQAGLDPLPFDGDGAGRLALTLQQKEQQAATTELSFTTPKTSLLMAGDVNIQNAGFGEGRARVSLKSADIEPYLLVTGVSLPQFGSGMPVDLAADVELSADTVKVSGLSGDVAGNAVAGSLSADRRAPGLPVTGDMSVDTIDLAWMGEAVFGPMENGVTGAPSKTPFATPLIGSTDVGINLSAKTLRADALGTITGFSGKVNGKAGGLTIDNASGTWQGGKLSGRLMMSNGDATGIVQAKLQVENADLAPLVWQKGGTPVATGKLDSTVSIEATGKSMDELMHGVSGSGEMRLKDFEIAGINPDALAPILAGADKLQGEVNEAVVRPIVTTEVLKGTTRLGSVTIPMTITGGAARVQNFTATAGPAQVSAEGVLDFVDGRIDAGLSIRYDAGEEAVAGGEPTVTLGYSGSLEQPDRRIDMAAMANFLSLRAFEQERRRVETLQASVLEKQRLRREVALYTFRGVEREAARVKAEAEERARQEAAEAERRSQEAERQEAARRAEAARLQQERQREIQRQNQQPSAPAPFTMPPAGDLFQEQPSGTGRSSNPSLPGVQP
ncbi:AsmA-like C-terminal region-containing protein [Neorhizobium sp. AL 9.2.2]|uniref:AsmA family protein n=1 Tax=Neorhizobium sp. AL 9.2.2 TaxID=2712894 RepID=UPI0015D4D10D|nr:AsmA-like C-terminal region-containing protein [Neorhizobium sp. AL 9.2.2]